MNVYILVRKKKIQVPDLLSGGLKEQEILDDIHNTAFQKLNDAEDYAKKINHEDSAAGVYIVALNLLKPKTTEEKVE